MAKTKGAKDKKPRRVTPEVIKNAQVSALVHGNRSEKFQKMLLDLGFKDKEMSVERLKEIAPEIVKDLDLIEKTAVVKKVLFEMYRKHGDIGLSMLNQMRELNIYLDKLKEEYYGREQELILNKQYLSAVELLRKLSNDVNKLNLDRTKFIADEFRKGGDSEIIDLKLKEED
jgi:hypothetical protein